MTCTLIEEVLMVLLRDAKARGAAQEDVLQILLSTFDRVFGVEPSAEDENLRLILAGRAGRAEIMQREGGCVSARRAAELYRGPGRASTDEDVLNAAREGCLIALKDGNGLMLFPAWQFCEDGVLPGLRQVLETLRESPGFTEISSFVFFLQGHPRLGATPLAALRAGRVDEVIEAARMETE